TGRIRWVSVPRRTIVTPSVQGRVISYTGHLWGDVRLNELRTGAATQLRSEVRRLVHRGAAGLVLDLRDDPGGYLDEAVRVASAFLDRGVVVSLQGAHTQPNVFHAGGGKATRLPLVVLVDRATASSAEVVAAALRDNKRALVVGQRTYGKALVQSIDPLGNGAALELTVAHYYTPSGADISRVGIAPDVRAVDRPRTPADEALAAALQVLARPTS
ncbi:MAG TPA: S41 family peptidase, partial [Gaiellaceae bacterium]|nr:S41 family peptidase [Gaiellaceae bacterium]